MPAYAGGAIQQLGYGATGAVPGAGIDAAGGVFSPYQLDEPLTTVDGLLIPILGEQASSDTTPPVSLFISDTRTTVSLVTGWESTDVTWSADEDCQAFQFREVASAAATVTDGTLLAAGGAVGANASQTTTIAASSLTAGDGSKLIKIFAQDLAGNWTT